MLYTCMYDIRSNRTCVGKPLVTCLTYIIPCLSSIYIRVTVLNPYLSCFLYICIYSVCLRWFIFEVIKKNSSASVLNSYNFTILIYKGTVFYLRNVCVSNQNICTFEIWLIFRLNDSEPKERRRKLSWGSMPRTLLEACTSGACLGNRSLFMLYPPLHHLKSGIPPPPLGITVNDP